MTITTQQATKARIRDVVLAYLSSRKGMRMVTMSDAIAHVRAHVPALETPASTLVDIIAGEAIVLGLHVELDGEPGDPGQPTFERLSQASESA